MLLRKVPSPRLIHVSLPFVIMVVVPPENYKVLVWILFVPILFIRNWFLRYSTSDGRFIIARDYLSIKIWDSHMSNKPIKNIPVNNYLRPALTQLYESGRHISHLIQLHLHPLNYSFLNPIKPLILTFLTSHLFNFPRLYVWQIWCHCQPRWHQGSHREL